jgi:hypothetical protein
MKTEWLVLTDQGNGEPVLVRADRIMAVVGIEGGSYVELDVAKGVRVFVSEAPTAVLHMIKQAVGTYAF